MPQAILTPKYVNAPKDGKKWASINCDGTYYSFDPAKMSFEKGLKYNVEFETKPYNGKDYHTILRIVETPTQTAGNSALPDEKMSKADWAAKDAHVTRLAIAKSCIEAKSTLDDADLWLAWVNNELPEQGPVN